MLLDSNFLLGVPRFPNFLFVFRFGGLKKVNSEITAVMFKHMLFLPMLKMNWTCSWEKAKFNTQAQFS